MRGAAGSRVQSRKTEPFEFRRVFMLSANWVEAGTYTDIRYHKLDGIAKITINRPHVRNAFRPLTVDEMSHALNDARFDPEIGVIIL